MRNYNCELLIVILGIRGEELILIFTLNLADN